MGRSIANILTALILMIALAIGVLIAVAVISPDTVASFLPQSATLTPEPAAVPPTVAVAAVVPTVTPTPTTDPLLPTFTPVTSPTRAEATITPTRRPTVTPSITPTFPPPTPTRTPTLTPTLTPTPGPSPTATYTQSPFPFTKSSDSPVYLRNYANTAGCNWMGIAGEVFDTAGNPVADGQYRIHVWDSGVDARLNTGSAKAYGPSGWEQFVLDQPAVRSYNVQLETSSGTAVSQVYRVQTRSSCNENLLYFIFTQNR